MKTEKLSEIWLFKKHSESEIKSWLKKLNYGFFKRANGGHANDGDNFQIWLNYKSEKELFEILEKLKIELKRIPINSPKAIPGKSYNWKEFEKFKSEIKDFPNFEQPLHIEINEIPCFCWIENGRISFSLSGSENGNGYEVTESDFNNCLKLESVFEINDLAKYVSSDYENWITCISRKVYPELFE